LISSNGSAVGGIKTSIGVDTSGNIVDSSGVHKVDGEDWLVQESLVDGVDEWWDDSVDGQRGESQTEDSVNWVLGEERSDGSGLSESGRWHGELVCSGISESDGVDSEESLG